MTERTEHVYKGIYTPKQSQMQEFLGDIALEKEIVENQSADIAKCCTVLECAVKKWYDKTTKKKGFMHGQYI